MNIPEVLQVKPIKSVDTMNIDTNILNPVVRTDKFMRWVLMRKGILDSGSCIALSLDNGSKDGVLPIQTGIHGLIKQAVLRIGSKIVCITDNYGKYATIRHCFQSQEERSQKDMVRCGTGSSICPERYNSGNAQKGGLYTLKDYEYIGNGTSANPTFIPFTQFELQTSGESGNQYYIKLSQLFPAMRNVSLPLYLINENCSIEITFNTQDSTNDGTIVKYSSQVDPADATSKVNVRDAVFLADYLTYDDDRMEQLASMVMSEEGLVIPYLDVITTTNSFKAVADPGGGNTTEVQETHELGLTGMKVQSILTHYHKPGDEVGNALGVYGSKAYAKPIKYNVRVNDKQVYPVDVESESYKAQQLSQCFGSDINVGVGQYSLDVSTDKSSDDRLITFNNYFEPGGLLINAANEGDLQFDNMLGDSHFTGVDFTIDGSIGQGVKIGQTPIRYLYNVTHNTADFSGREVTYFSIVERQMAIRGGNVTVSA
jgi:hypothetical protein